MDSQSLHPAILIADDHELFRDALSSYIARADPNMRVVNVGSLPEARQALNENGSFSLVMLDWHMPGVFGMNDIRAMIQDFPGTRFALMSGVVDRAQVHQALESGVCGYFPKTLSGRLLIEGIRAVLKGGQFIPTLPGSSTLMPAYHGEKMFFQPRRELDQRGQNGAMVNVDLTDRELEVLIHLAKGATNNEIAEQLGIKDVTVKLHLRNAFEKIGVRNRTEAALKCRELGLVVDGNPG
jgi:two-component system nitrate/nitrite response regulator NarL